MKSSEILELVRAGYTKEEIQAMDMDPAPAAEKAEEVPETSEPETPIQVSEDKKKDVSGSSSVNELIDEKFNELKAMIQDTNRKNVENPEPEKQEPYTAFTAIQEFFGGES